MKRLRSCDESNCCLLCLREIRLESGCLNLVPGISWYVPAYWYGTSRMSERANRMGKHHWPAGTSWYGGAKTDARRALSLSIDSIFYSKNVAPSLYSLMPWDLPTVPKISTRLVPSGTRVIILHPHVFTNVAYAYPFHSIRNVCKWRYYDLVCIF